MHSDTGINQFLINSGPVTDQTFAGGSPMTTPLLYVGPGDYSTLFNAAATNIILTSDINGTYALSSVSFG